jgi:hypothetical protein
VLLSPLSFFETHVGNGKNLINEYFTLLIIVMMEFVGRLCIIEDATRFDFNMG